MDNTKATAAQIDALVAQWANQASAQGIPIDASELARTLSLKTKFETILYAGHVPVTGETNYNFFGNIAAGENTLQFTNLITQGQLPFNGMMKVYGIGMTVTPYILTTVAQRTDLIAQVAGSLEFKAGSLYQRVLALPLQFLFSQRSNCCLGASASGNLQLQMVGSSPFVGKVGFYPLPSAPEIESGTNFGINVNWNAVWGANSHLVTHFFLFGYQLTGYGQ